MGKIISLANQKGGCGKSTITTFFAMELANRGFKVKIIDADFQKTIFNCRLYDVESIDDTTNMPDVSYSSAANVTDELNELINEYDYIFIDIPGNVVQKGLLGVLFACDAIIVVHDPNKAGFTSTLDFLKFLDTNIINNESYKDFKTPTIKNIINRFAEREVFHKDFINNLDAVSSYPWFKKPIRDLTVFKTISTIDRYSHPKYNYELEMIVEEFIETLNN